MAADASAEITELTVDDHACLTFGEQDELFDVTAAFVRDGLAGGLKVVWLSDTGPGSAVAELSRRGISVEPAMAAGQMTADGCEGHLLAGQVFSADAAIGWLTRQLASSRELGSQASVATTVLLPAPNSTLLKASPWTQPATSILAAGSRSVAP